MLLGGLDLNVLPLGVDRAFGQSAPTHDVDWAYRRACYGRGFDAGYRAGILPWDRAKIPNIGYLFERPRISGEDPIVQAEALLAQMRAVAKTRACVVDWERDVWDGHYDLGYPPLSELQAIVDHLDGAGVLVVLYASESGFPTSIKHVAARIVANYSQRPHITHDAWQWTASQPLPDGSGGTGIDRDIWIQEDTFRLIFGVPMSPIVVPVPLPSTPNAAVRFPMLDLVPQSLQRVVDLPAGTVLRVGPSVDAARYTTITDLDSGKSTKALGLIGAAIGVPEAGGWYQVADGDRGVWVRRTDIEGTPRSQAVAVGA